MMQLISYQANDLLETVHIQKVHAFNLVLLPWQEFLYHESTTMVQLILVRYIPLRFFMHLISKILKYG